MITLEEYHKEQLQEALRISEVEGKLLDDVLFEMFTDLVVEEGELSTADRVYYHRRGIQVDGYGGSIKETEDGLLSLVATDFLQDEALSTLTQTEIDASLRRVENFFSKALGDDFQDELDQGTPEHGLARMIKEQKRDLTRARVVLVTNKVLSTRFDGRPAGKWSSYPVSFSIWDIGRFYRTEIVDEPRIEIDLEEDEDGPINVLSAHLPGAGYESFLAVVPGNQLARIYDKYGARLLQQNVRVFLQAKGKVNRGIRDTIEHNPDMFFAYNNGLTATAGRVETRYTDAGLQLTKLHDLQIVNGGQTTASIHAASRKGAVDLSKVFVQMKLSVIDGEEAKRVVPKISAYANTQNRIAAADLVSNDEFHIRMENLSRQTFAPQPDGTAQQTKWFYERARGQYQDERGRRGASERRKFDLEFPRAQLFTKTDLAKFINSWGQIPHQVSRGAQKNFADFSIAVAKKWEEDNSFCNRLYFTQAVAKMIMFRRVERLVSEQPWYAGGYRANIVTYAIAKVAYDCEQVHCTIDFDAIWRRQALPPVVEEGLAAAATVAYQVLVNPDTAMQSANVTEWAKAEGCWTRVKSQRALYPEGFLASLPSVGEQKDEERGARKIQKEYSEIEAQIMVAKADKSIWAAAKDWGRKQNAVTVKEFGILDYASKWTSVPPSGKQSVEAVRILKKLHEIGFKDGLELFD